MYTFLNLQELAGCAFFQDVHLNVAYRKSLVINSPRGLDNEITTIDQKEGAVFLICLK